MADRPRLAIIVIGYRAPAGIVGAVKSLIDQGAPLEIVVVNSGGGNTKALLTAAGIDLPVLEVEHRLFAGAARNLGIAATQAPFVAFLADDCLASPGWAQARLRRHLAGDRAVASAILNSHPRNLVACAAYLTSHMRRLPGLSAEQAQCYGVSFDRSLFEDHGLFDETIASGEDTEFLARLPAASRPVWEPRVQTVHRNETRLLVLLADQYRRGRRYGAYIRRVAGKQPSHPFRKVFRDRRNVGKLAKAGLCGRDRTFAMLSLPIVWLALFAKSIGAAAGARYGDEAGRRQ